MGRLYKKVREVALPPGSYAHREQLEPVKISILDYSQSFINECVVNTVEDAAKYKDSDTVTWINIDGYDADVMRQVEHHFGVHALVLEDVANGGQRPKIEDYDQHIFFILKMIYNDVKTNDIYGEQIGLVLGKNFVISFQEKTGDVFNPVRERLRVETSRIRRSGADYLTYALIDAIVDNYFVVLEEMGERIDVIEDELLTSIKSDMPMRIYRLKSKVIYLRKQIWPFREVLAGFQRMDSKLVSKPVGVFLRDVYDHTIQVNDTIEAFRDAVSGLHDIYLSSVSNKMNEIMKVLTIFAAIFIPLTFIAGIYGMNFDNMPELHWENGYHYALGLMATVGIGMLLYFKRKDWI